MLPITHGVEYTRWHVLFYTVLFIIEMGLMVKYIRKGPYQDVAETEDWMRRHEARLKTSDDAVTMPAE